VTNLLAGVGLTAAALALGHRSALLSGLVRPGTWLTAALVAASAAFLASAVAYTPLPVIAALTQMEPAFALLLAWRFDERVGKAEAVSLLVGFAGTAVLVGGLQRTELLGVAYMAAASLGAAWYSLRFAEDARTLAPPASAYMAVVTGLGGVLLLPWQRVWGLSGGTYAVCAVAALCYGAGYVLVYRGMRRVQATHVLLLKPLGALTAAVLGVMFLDAAVTANLIVGGALILLAGQVTGWSARRRSGR
jgi:drug/metabolite transporter (DMT)-like permease